MFTTFKPDTDYPINKYSIVVKQSLIKELPRHPLLIPGRRQSTGSTGELGVRNLLKVVCLLSSF